MASASAGRALRLLPELLCGCSSCLQLPLPAFVSASLSGGTACCALAFGSQLSFRIRNVATFPSGLVGVGVPGQGPRRSPVCGVTWVHPALRLP